MSKKKNEECSSVRTHPVTLAVAKDSPYYLPKAAISELWKILQYNDTCTSRVEKVTRDEVLDLLSHNKWWSGSYKGLNSLLKANFGRTFTGASPELTNETVAVNPNKRRVLSKQALSYLERTLRNNDKAKDASKRVTRQEVISKLNNDYSLDVGSTSSLNRLLKANFGRTLSL